MSFGAVLGGLSVASSIFGGISSSKSANAQVDALQESAEVQRDALDFQKEVYNTNYADTAAYRDIGTDGMNVLRYLSGMGSAPLVGAASIDTREIAGTSPGAIEVIRSDETDIPGLSSNALSEMGRLFGGSSSEGSTTYRVGDQTFDTYEAAEKYASGLGSAARTVYDVNGKEFSDLEAATAYANSFGTQYEMPDWAKSYEGTEFSFEADPGYQWRMDEANESIQAAMAAQGLGSSGNMLRALQENSQNMASNEYSNAWNRWANREDTAWNQWFSEYNTGMNNLYNLTGLGTSGTNMSINAGNNAASQVGSTSSGIGNTLSNIGTATANGISGINNSFQNLTGNLGTLAAMNHYGFFSPGT